MTATRTADVAPGGPTGVTEIAAVAMLVGGPLEYTLRRSPRSRGLRVVIHPDRGVVVTVPARGRRGWADPERHVTSFLAEREPWLRRHLARQARDRAELEARGGLRDGAVIRFRGELHRLRLVPARTGAAAVTRRADRRRRRGRDHRPRGGSRPTADGGHPRGAGSSHAPGPRSSATSRRHAAALGVSPAAISIRDQRTRWGSASHQGRLAFSWRLILAPPEALETVVVHELAHLRVFGHGPRFWALVATPSPRPQGLAPLAARAFGGAAWGARRAAASPEAAAPVGVRVVEMRGLEPLTPAMRTRCSSS